MTGESVLQHLSSVPRKGYQQASASMSRASANFGKYMTRETYKGTTRVQLPRRARKVRDQDLHANVYAYAGAAKEACCSRGIGDEELSAYLPRQPDVSENAAQGKTKPRYQSGNAFPSAKPERTQHQQIPTSWKSTRDGYYCRRASPTYGTRSLEISSHGKGFRSMVGEVTTRDEFHQIATKWVRSIY